MSEWGQKRDSNRMRGQKLRGLMFCMIWLCFVAMVLAYIYRYTLDKSGTNLNQKGELLITPELYDPEVEQIRNMCSRNKDEDDGEEEKAEDDGNDKEVHRFKNLLDIWPSSKPKGVVYFLIQIRDSKRINLFLRILKQVDDYLHVHFPYPIIIFHEGALPLNIKSKFMDTVRHSCLFFQKVEFGLPVFINPVLVPTGSLCSDQDIGYRHMIRFHAFLVYKMSILQNVDYAWRLDDDSELLGPLLHDPFIYMQKHQLLYGYHDIVDEDPACRQGLSENITVYLEKNKITPKNAYWDENLMYYNNFEISALSFWRSKEYQDYFKFIDYNGGIYFKRWGDAPIKSMAVKIFLDPSKAHRFKCIQYKHQGIGNNNYFYFRFLSFIGC